MLSPSTGFPTPAHMPPSTGTSPRAYIQLSGNGYTPALYATLAPYAKPADHTQPSNTEPIYTIQNPLPTISPLAAMITTSTGHGRELSNLAKIYTNNAKYSGRNNSFTFKLAIFHDIYSRADVLPEAKMKAFPTMLKGLALNYYYSNISTSAIAMNFDRVCNSIRNYFEGAKYKQSVLSK